MEELFDNKCQMRVMRPEGGWNFACMHVKALIFDSKTLLTGSVNMTHNGMENNKEHMYRISESAPVSAVLADFEKEWAAAEPDTRELIDDMLSRHAKRLERDAAKPRSKSLNRGVSRSLSSELDEAQSLSRVYSCNQGRHRSAALANAVQGIHYSPREDGDLEGLEICNE